jgi:hypothetical protein
MPGPWITSSRRLAAVVSAVVMIATAVGSAQDAARRPPPLDTAQLPAPAVAMTAGAREVRARLTLLQPPVPSTTTPGEPAAAPPTRIDVLSVRHIEGAAPMDLRPEISAFHLVLVSVDAAGTPVAWQLVLDPRRLRAEFPGADGVRAGTEVISPVADLQFVIPDDPRITATHVYEPRWNGTTHVLHPVGICEVGAR